MRVLLALMKVVLATGIYPPQIGGPATYVAQLSERLAYQGIKVKIITYGDEPAPQGAVQVVTVSRAGGTIVRWIRYALALRRHAADADIVYAFSSVSCGIPLWLSHLKHPKRILRLGGDFLWERYTDGGGDQSLKEWYAAGPRFHSAMNGLLRTFDHIVYSTEFQQSLYEHSYRALPSSTVVLNALPDNTPVLHEKHDPFRLLFLGRFVPFKNLGSLIHALAELPGALLTLVGDGPLQPVLHTLIDELHLADRVKILPTQAGAEKEETLRTQDVLVLPSYTELSPNTALEARSLGLPVLLTAETGLNHPLTDGTQLRNLRTPRDIVNAIREIEASYSVLAERSAMALPKRTWEMVTEEHIRLFQSIL